MIASIRIARRVSRKGARYACTWFGAYVLLWVPYRVSGKSEEKRYPYLYSFPKKEFWKRERENRYTFCAQGACGIFLAAVPMMMLVAYVMYYYEVYAVFANLYGGVATVFVMIFLLLSDDMGNLLEFNKWFFTIYSST
eukprot:5669028-Pyramimonas_sp.AAC.1